MTADATTPEPPMLAHEIAVTELVKAGFTEERAEELVARAEAQARPAVASEHGVVVQPEQPHDAAAPRGDTSQADPGETPGHSDPPVASEGLRAALTALVLAAYGPANDAGAKAYKVALLDARALLVWDHLEAQPGFNEQMAQAEADLAAGKGTPFAALASHTGSVGALDVERLRDHQPEARCYDGDADVGCSCGEWVSYRVGRVGYPTWLEHIAAAYTDAERQGES